MLRRLIASALLTSTLLVAPAGAAPAAGWKKLRVPTASFSIQVPAGWTDISSATPQVLKSLSRYPTLRAAAQQAGRSGALKLIVADVHPGSFAFLDVSVQRAQGLAAGPVAGEIAKQLAASGFLRGKAVQRPLRLPAGAGVELTYEINASPQPLASTAFILKRGDDLYVLTYATLRSLERGDAAVFERSARSLRFLPGIDLTPLVLTPRQVGAGYQGKLIPGGDAVIGEVTLDLCVTGYPSENLRVARRQLVYNRGGHSAGLSNEVVRYVPGGAQQALRELRAKSAKCLSGPTTTTRNGDRVTFRMSPVSDARLLPGSIAVRIDATGTVKGKHVDVTTVAVYQVDGDTLSGVYAYSAPGVSKTATVRLALHAAEESAHNLTANRLTA